MRCKQRDEADKPGHADDSGCCQRCNQENQKPEMLCVNTEHTPFVIVQGKHHNLPVQQKKCADTEDTENGETVENNENMITELTANTAAEISGKEFTLKTEQAYPDDDEIIAVTAVYGDQ